jgi:hypothetical protein
MQVRAEASVASMPPMRASILVLVLFSLACQAKDAPVDKPASADQPASAAAPEPAAAAPDPSPKTELATAMTEHFAQASALERAVIDGDLEAVATHAAWLVDELPAASFPPAWQPAVQRMQKAAAKAGEAASADDLAAAATATAEVIAACGSCHASTGGGPKFDDVDPGTAPVGDDSKNRMLRHQWAAERMREGMIGPSEPRWLAGAGAVSVAPPEPCPIENAEILADEVLQLREKIYELGAQASVTQGLDARAAVYGEYLSTCAGCHTGGC